MDNLADLFLDFDYGVETDDFVIYEVHRLIEEDRASFEDEEFRRIIDEGIREHIEENLNVRAGIAMRLRRSLTQFDRDSEAIARKAIRALEDIDASLRNVSLIVRTYTAYVFARLQDAADEPQEPEDEARLLIERWQNGELLREQMTAKLKQIGRPAVGPTADLLFGAPEDRVAAEAAVDTLSAIRCSSSARVLTHAILEPMLDEDLELKAYDAARKFWPLPRHYILYTLATHGHEDLPFRWYQLLVNCSELDAVDLILDEALVHGSDPEFQEDINAILELLQAAHDPDTQDKVVALLNSPETPPPVVPLLESALNAFMPRHDSPDGPWDQAARRADLNKEYLKAAKLYDTGKTDEALSRLNRILANDPKYPFALNLLTLATAGTSNSSCT